MRNDPAKAETVDPILADNRRIGAGEGTHDPGGEHQGDGRRLEVGTGDVGGGEPVLLGEPGVDAEQED